MPASQHQGLSLPHHKLQTREQAISVAPTSEYMVLPLTQHGSVELIPVVAMGDSVRMGQIVARPAEPLGASLHSPVSGSVIAIGPRSSAKPASTAAMSIVLRNDYHDLLATQSADLLEWSTLPSLTLCKQLALGGIVGLGGAAFPLAIKAAAHIHHGIEQLIINGAECEPFITCDDRLMREQAATILQGTQMLLHATQAARASIAIEADKPEAIAAMQGAAQALNDARIDIRVIASTYPSGDEAQLIRQISDKEIPQGKLPADIGVIVSNVSTVYACARWVMHAEPLITRVVTVSGNGVSTPGNYVTRIGTSMHDLLQHCGADLAEGNAFIMGGAMMGQALAHTDYPIIKASNCLIVSNHTEIKPAAIEHACIRCGECAYACPVHLLPQQLLVQVRHGNVTALNQLGLQDCIECGSCDYVCPSHIRLASRFHEAKQLI
ncbi:MAG: electron transport complex subunit RsxC [Steroidobacteraceae bacterium]